MGKLSEEQRAKNEVKCGQNKPVIFEGCLAIDRVDRFGKDALDLKFLFNEGISYRRFDPGQSIRRKSTLSIEFSALCEALGLDFADIQQCYGWEEVVLKFCNFVNVRRGESIYAKFTIDENGWLTPGEGKCFSRESDMEYTEADKQNLTVKEEGTHIPPGELPGYPQDWN